MSINMLYHHLGRRILSEGTEVHTRGTKSKELICPPIVLDLNEAQVVTLEHRKLKPLYVIDEFLWYMSRSLLAKDISGSAPFWDTLKDSAGDVVSNYGHWIFEEEDISSARSLEANWKTRFDYCINLLVADPDTRKAIINIHGVDNMAANPKDTPCTLTIQFLIRDNKLNMVVNMRSNDFVIGFCNDILQFQFIALMVYAVLKNRCGMKKLKLGQYYHNAASMHIYDKHYGNPVFNEFYDPSALNPAAEDFRVGLQTNLIDILVNTDIVFGSKEMSNYAWLNLLFAKWFSNLKSKYAVSLATVSEASAETLSPVANDPLLISIPLDEGF